MDDAIKAVQGVTERQRQIFNGTVRSLKWIFPSFPGKLKDSIIMKKPQTGEGNWTCVKEFMWWTIDMEAGTATLLERKSQEFLKLLAIPFTQLRIGRKELKRLVGKICSMHLSVPGAVAHI